MKVDRKTLDRLWSKVKIRRKWRYHIEAVRVVPCADPARCWPWKDKLTEWGYGRFSINGRKHYAHRLVCEWTHGPCPPDKQHAAHTCGKRDCCNPAHLYWATQSENELDKVKHGTDCRGERHPANKITEKQARAALTDPRSCKAIAEEYGVSASLIEAIRNGRKWRWLKGAA